MELITFDTKWTGDDHTTIVALEDGKPVGTCMVDYYGKSKRQALFWNLQVSKDSRRKGVGKMLLDKAIEFCKSRGCTDVRLVWRKVDSPEWVLRWYERNGFDGCAFGDGIVDMRRELN